MREYCTQWLGVTEMFVTMNIFWAAFVCCWAVPGDIRGGRRASSPSLESSPFRGKKIDSKACLKNQQCLQNQSKPSEEMKFEARIQ